MSTARFRGKSSRKAFRFSRFLYPVCGLLLVGPTLGVWVGLVRLTRSLPFDPAVVYPLLAGALAYLLLYFVFRKPMTVYVFGHELTHAAAALLSGYKVKSLFCFRREGKWNSPIATFL
ncbi:MAG: hypothetical protein IPN90_03555 [Elusimicrobia bacterium]|nr:hypothetical protein [Elusimicrobiota bacterium]